MPSNYGAGEVLEIKPVNPKGINREYSSDAEAEAPILWPPDAKNQLIGKDPDVGKDWGQEENGATEDKMSGGHHQLNGHEFEQTTGDGERRKLGMLQFMGSQRVRYNLGIEQQQFAVHWVPIRP